MSDSRPLDCLPTVRLRHEFLSVHNSVYVKRLTETWARHQETKLGVFVSLCFCCACEYFLIFSPFVCMIMCNLQVQIFTPALQLLKEKSCISFPTHLCTEKFMLKLLGGQLSALPYKALIHYQALLYC